MIKVEFPQVLARAAKLPATVYETDGGSVAEAFRALCTSNDGLQQFLFHPNGEVKEHFLLTSGNALVAADAALPEGAEVKVLLATSGGMDGPAPMTLSEGLGDGRGVPLSNEEVSRYARHITLPGVGRRGQERLKAARVLVIGAGGLGSPVSLYLAAAGVGKLGLVDFDVVERSNLQRQIIHSTRTLGMLKVESARMRLLELNPDLAVETFAEPLDTGNALEIISRFDLVVDASDTFTCRYIVNDACTILRRPLVYGAIHQFDGQVSVFNHAGGPCYRCLFPARPPAELAPNCAAAGVIGVLPGVIGLMQATEAIKLILGLGDSLSGRLLRFDALSMRFDEIGFARRPDCPDCGTQRSALHDHRGAEACASSAPAAFEPPPGMLIAPQDLAASLGAFTLLDIREPEETEICGLSGSVNIPLAELEARLGEVPRDRPLCLICYSDLRARKAAPILVRAGFAGLRLLAGGLKAWKRDVDPEMPIY